ncbi:hypothetical protein AB0I22_26315 [Streptomyces sp. NPDC050610]|uniref:hypothetical protein n=1 Tax=Streptomyces sp. NPDC050610 TaxID=3157097 RepID=UPI00342A79CE
MRMPRRLAAAVLTAAGLGFAAPPPAAPAERVPHVRDVRDVRDIRVERVPYVRAEHVPLVRAEAERSAFVRAEQPSPSPDRPETRCRAEIRGSHAAADCFNPNSFADRVQLHIECARWWDPDMDGANTAVGPAQHVSLAGRCWKEIRAAWVTHH